MNDLALPLTLAIVLLVVAALTVVAPRGDAWIPRVLS
jgi:hypothetical protein